MALEQKLSLRMSQRLVMTPSLQQAIKLLQMTRLELEGKLQEELEENPLLEREEEQEEEVADEEPEVEEEESPMDDIDLDAYFDDYLEGSSSTVASSSYEAREAAPIENAASDEPTLYEHLLFQVRMNPDLPEKTRVIAELIIGSLDDDGFLQEPLSELRMLGATPEEREEYRLRVEARESNDRGEDSEAEGDGGDRDADEAGGRADGRADGPADARDEEPADEADDEPAVPGFSVEEVTEALELVRSLDPPGVAQPDLRHSLLYQLRHLGEEETLSYALIDQHWDRFLKRQFPAIAKDLGLPLEDLKEPVERVKSLETRPGRRFGGEATRYVEPDVVVVKVSGDYVIQVNDDGMPRLRVSKAYLRMLRKMKRDGREKEARQFIKEKMRSAMWLIKSLDQRQRTIYKVADSIVKQQKGFLDKGVHALKPMVLRDVADDIGMHESTVSRVVSNKYIHTPRGLYPMKFFFHSGIDRDYGEDISSLSVKRKIEKLIEAEDPHKPLSDSALMRLLNREGIKIARRTVAKYRDELQIPSSTDRKQVF